MTGSVVILPEELARIDGIEVVFLYGARRSPLGRYLRAVFDKPPAKKAAREFDRVPPGSLRGEAGEGSDDPRRMNRSRGHCSTRQGQRALALTLQTADDPHERPAGPDDGR